MPSMSAWKYARPPNYDENVDKTYPYSEVPYLGEYNLVKIPTAPKKLIEHVDYWGEGRITVVAGCSGFADCYNINHVHQLVSNGPDTNRKIPNRIPVVSYTNCDTSGYIKNDSVELVTLMGAPINDSCAKDIGRIINDEVGKVVVFGFDDCSADIENLEKELKKKNLNYCQDFNLTNKLLGLTLFDNYRAYLNLSEMSDYLYKNIVDSNYESAVTKSKFLNDNNHGSKIFDVVTKLLKEGNKNILSYAYQLWNSNADIIVTNYFPLPIQAIFKNEYVVILNKKYNLALKLDANTDSYNDRLAWGDNSDKSSIRVLWKIMPIWNDNSVTFKITNMEHGMFLKLDVNTDEIGDRKAWGANNSDEERYVWILEPIMQNYDLMFLIINKRYNQGLKLGVDTDEYNDRLLWGHNGSVSDNPNNFLWYINCQRSLFSCLI